MRDRKVGARWPCSDYSRRIFFKERYNFVKDPMGIKVRNNALAIKAVPLVADVAEEFQIKNSKVAEK